MASAIDSGLNSIPVGDDATSNFNEFSLLAILSAKHDPIERIELVWLILWLKGFICVLVYSCIINPSLSYVAILYLAQLQPAHLFLL